MSSGVEVTGARQVFDGLVEQLDGLEGEILFGVFGDAPDHVSRDGRAVPMVEIATAHELGLGVPERSFLRGYAAGPGGDELGDAGAEAVGQVVDGRKVAEAMADVGEVAVEGVRERMLQGITPALRRPLDPERDQRGIPLVDTEQLIDAISSTWEGS